MTEPLAKPHVVQTSPTHDVMDAIKRANKIYVATLVAPGARTTYILIPKTQARELMKLHDHAFTKSENGNLFIGPAARILE